MNNRSTIHSAIGAALKKKGLPSYSALVGWIDSAANFSGKLSETDAQTAFAKVVFSVTHRVKKVTDVAKFIKQNVRGGRSGTSYTEVLRANNFAIFSGKQHGDPSFYIFDLQPKVRTELVTEEAISFIDRLKAADAKAKTKIATKTKAQTKKASSGKEIAADDVKKTPVDKPVKKTRSKKSQSGAVKTDSKISVSDDDAISAPKEEIVNTIELITARPEKSHIVLDEEFPDAWQNIERKLIKQVSGGWEHDKKGNETSFDRGGVFGMWDELTQRYTIRSGYKPSVSKTIKPPAIKFQLAYVRMIKQGDMEFFITKYRSSSWEEEVNMDNREITIYSTPNITESHNVKKVTIPSIGNRSMGGFEVWAHKLKDNDVIVYHVPTDFDFDTPTVLPNCLKDIMQYNRAVAELVISIGEIDGKSGYTLHDNNMITKTVQNGYGQEQKLVILQDAIYYDCEKKSFTHKNNQVFYYKIYFLYYPDDVSDPEWVIVNMKSLKATSPTLNVPSWTRGSYTDIKGKIKNQYNLKGVSVTELNDAELSKTYAAEEGLDIPIPIGEDGNEFDAKENTFNYDSEEYKWDEEQLKTTTLTARVRNYRTIPGTNAHIGKSFYTAFFITKDHKIAALQTFTTDPLADQLKAIGSGNWFTAKNVKYNKTASGGLVYFTFSTQFKGSIEPVRPPKGMATQVTPSIDYVEQSDLSSIDSYNDMNELKPPTQAGGFKFHGKRW